jgi:hypothetical protein
MCFSIPSHEVDDIVNAGNQNGIDQGNGGPSPNFNENRIAHEMVQHHTEPRRDQGQTNGVLDMAVMNSNKVDWMGSRMETISPLPRMSEEGPLSPHWAPNCLPGMTTESGLPSFSFQPHRSEATGSLERLLSIIDMALEIVNTN